MPEIHPDNLREMHANLTAAGITEYAGIAFDTIRLEARVDVARDTIITLKRERDALREQANAAHAALDEAGAPACDGVLSGRITALAASLNAATKQRDSLREQANAAHAALAEAQAENAPLRARRNALHDALARMGNALSAAGHHAGFGLDEVEQALAAALAERDALRAALTEANTVNSRLAADLSRAQTERDAARAELAQTKAQLDVANADFEAGADDYEIVSAERDTLRAEIETLRARLAERPTPPDHRDPPVSTAAEEAIERIWSALFDKASIERDDFATAASGDPAGELLDLADAVESALDKANEQIRTISDARDHATKLATEQFLHRLYRT